MNENDKKSPVRQKWTKSVDFIFATVGCSIGLGNVWRFPYLCFQYGGGAFLIPYLLFASFIGIPLILMETTLGQKVRGGLFKSWTTVPIFKGIAFAGLVLILHSNVYYPILMVWMLKYIVSSFSSQLPWSHCGNEWNTAACFARNAWNKSGANEFNASSMNNHSNEVSKATPGEEFWKYDVLGISPSLEHLGGLRGDLVLYLAILWIGFYLSTFKGIGWTAKVVYVTATLPFILILTILVRGAMLDGATDGIKMYIFPNVTKLLELNVWVSAGSQVLYSYFTCTGALVILGSYNRQNHNVFRDSLLIGCLNSLTSFVSGFAVFSTLGFMAKYQNTTVDKVAQSGPGLAFIAYPEALSLLPFPQLWCALFFLTLLTLGFDSQFVGQECFVATILDNFAYLRNLRHSRAIVQGVCAIFNFLLGLTMLTEGGIYVFGIYLYAAAGWALFLVALFEFLAIGWIYGADRFWNELEGMIGSKPGRLWFKISCKFIGPVVSFGVVIYYLATVKPLTHDDYVYPWWAQLVAHLISLSSVVIIPIYAAVKIFGGMRSGKHLAEIIFTSKEMKNSSDVDSTQDYDSVELKRLEADM